MPVPDLRFPTLGPALTAAVLALGLAGSGRAQPTGEGMKLALDYSGSLYVKVLDVHVEQAIAPTGFSAAAHIKTSGLLALFRKINLNAASEGRFERGVAQPHEFSYLNTDGKKDRKVSATWSAVDVTTQSAPAFKTMGDPAATREQRLEAADPLTILTRLTVLGPSAKPCQGVSQFYDGKQRYDVDYALKGEAKPDGRERRLGVTSTVQCTLHYHEVAGFKKKPANQRGQGLAPDVAVGFGRMGASGPWVVSYIRATTFLGNAEIDLVKASLSGERPAELHAAL